MATGFVKFRLWGPTAAGQTKVETHAAVLNLKTSDAVIAAVRTGFAMVQTMAASFPSPGPGGISAGGDMEDFGFPTP
jgi:hypothetical protein